jgi:lysophospholipase L1-like esterase
MGEKVTEQNVPLQKRSEEAASTVFEMAQHARYTGRIDWNDAKGPILSWAGSSIAVRFQGSAIAIQMIAAERDDSWLDISINGGSPRKLHIGKKSESILLASGHDAESVHTLHIYKRTEAMFGTVQLLGFTLPEGGMFHSPPPHLDRRIEIVGDSISAGSGNEGKDGDPNIAEHENNSLAYGTLAANTLNAEHHTIAVSGIGLTVNYGEERTNTMKQQYELLHPLHPEWKWDFSQWTPDVVILNLGTNDNNYTIDSEYFITSYIELVARIHDRHPEAHIIMALGPFQLSPVKEHIYEAFNQIRAAGNSHVHYFLFEQVNAEKDGMGETGHPNVITHAIMAERLVSEIKQVTGW